MAEVACAVACLDYILISILLTPGYIYTKVLHTRVADFPLAASSLPAPDGTRVGFGDHVAYYAD